MSIYSGPADWWTDGTDAGRTHIATKGIVQTGIVLNLDAGAYTSYPGIGTTWYDLSGNGNHCTLYNSVTYDQTSGGRMIFDGNTQYAKTPNLTNIKSIFMSFNIFDPTTNWNYLFDSRPNGTWLARVIDWTTGNWDQNNYINGNASVYTSVPLSQNVIVYYEHLSTHTSTINIFSRYSDNECMGGSLYNFIVYNRTLSAAEIQQNFNTLRSRFGI